MTSEFGIAVHAMVFLHHKGDMVSSEVLAENICTNPARVRKVMAQLKRAGLVETHEGAVGGYRFAGSADTVTLCDIAQAVGAAFVSASWRSGDVDKPCLVASGMGALMDEVYTGLDALCQGTSAKRHGSRAGGAAVRRQAAGRAVRPGKKRKSCRGARRGEVKGSRRRFSFRCLF